MTISEVRSEHKFCAASADTDKYELEDNATLKHTKSRSVTGAPCRTSDPRGFLTTHPATAKCLLWSYALPRCVSTV